MGLTFEINDRSLKVQLGTLVDRLEDKTGLLQAAGSIVRESVRRNFAQGGRPQKWKPLKYREGQPLRKTGRLQNSITSKVEEDKAYVGTNVVYAAAHHFGAAKGSFGQKMVTVRSHTRKKNGTSQTVSSHSRRMMLPWGNIPARPFLLVQDDDVVAIEGIAANYLMEGNQ